MNLKVKDNSLYNDTEITETDCDQTVSVQSTTSEDLTAKVEQDMSDFKPVG